MHFMRDGAKEFFVKRMPKEFESEFNMPASMFRDHLLFFGNSVESRSRRYEGPTVPLTIQISIHSHCTALGLDRDPCPLVECYIVWEPNGLLSVGMNAQNRNTHVQVQLETIDIFLLACHVCGKRFREVAMHARSVKAHHWFEEHFSNSLELLHVLILP